MLQPPVQDSNILALHGLSKLALRICGFLLKQRHYIESLNCIYILLMYKAVVGIVTVSGNAPHFIQVIAVITV